MRKIKTTYLKFAIALAFMVIVSACTGVSSLTPSAQPAQLPTEISLPTPTVDPTAPVTETVTASPAITSTTAAPEPVILIPGVQAALGRIAQILNTKAEELTLFSYEEVEWRDSCLGVKNPDLMCLQVITPGYRILVQHAGQLYEFHTNQSGGRVIEAPQPNSDVSQSVLVWKRTVPNCLIVEIKDISFAYSACGSAQNQAQPMSRQRLSVLRELTVKYAAFDADTSIGHITFAGTGEVIATVIEQRMIAEFAQLTYMDVSNDPTYANTDPVLIWHREGGIAGFCDDVTVSIVGEVNASSCKGAASRNIGKLWLTSQQLETFYSWVDTLASFKQLPSDKPMPDELLITVDFHGRGKQIAADETMKKLDDFIQSLYLALTRK